MEAAAAAAAAAEAAEAEAFAVAFEAVLETAVAAAAEAEAAGADSAAEAAGAGAEAFAVVVEAAIEAAVAAAVEENRGNGDRETGDSDDVGGGDYQRRLYSSDDEDDGGDSVGGCGGAASAVSYKESVLTFLLKVRLWPAWKGSRHLCSDSFPGKPTLTLLPLGLLQVRLRPTRYHVLQQHTTPLSYARVSPAPTILFLCNAAIRSALISLPLCPHFPYYTHQNTLSVLPSYHQPRCPLFPPMHRPSERAFCAALTTHIPSFPPHPIHQNALSVLP